MLRNFERLLRLPGTLNLTKIGRVCNGGIPDRNVNPVFHPRLHDAYIMYISTVPKRFQSTSSEVSVNDTEAELDDLFSEVVIEVKGHETAVLQSYVTFMEAAANELDITTTLSTPPKHIWRRTLNKAVFASKRAKVQYEIRTHYKVLTLKCVTGSTADTYLEYIQRNLPEGSAMKVTKHKLCQLPESVREAQKQRTDSNQDI